MKFHFWVVATRGSSSGSGSCSCSCLQTLSCFSAVFLFLLLEAWAWKGFSSTYYTRYNKYSTLFFVFGIFRLLSGSAECLRMEDTVLHMGLRDDSYSTIMFFLGFSRCSSPLPSPWLQVNDTWKYSNTRLCASPSNPKPEAGRAMVGWKLGTGNWGYVRIQRGLMAWRHQSTS